MFMFQKLFYQTWFSKNCHQNPWQIHYPWQTHILLVGSLDRRHHFFHALFLKHRSWSMRHIHKIKAKTNIAKRRNNFRTCKLTYWAWTNAPIVATRTIIPKSSTPLTSSYNKNRTWKKKTHKKSPNPKIKTMMKMCN